MQQLEEISRDARPVPLTEQVRFDKRQAYSALEGMRSEAAGATEVLEAVDALDAAVRRARPVPLTEQVRIEREELDALVGHLRDAISRGNRHPPTN